MRGPLNVKIKKKTMLKLMHKFFSPWIYLLNV